MFNQVTPVIQHNMRSLCLKAYPGHPKGCPNFGKRGSCPPRVRCFDEIFDMEKPIFIIYNAFPIGEHIQRMQDKHPEWSDRQLSCCLYWQGTARKQLQAQIVQIMNTDLYGKGYTVTKCPEAMGVNITETMKQIGIELEWPPVNVAYQVAIAAVKK